VVFAVSLGRITELLKRPTGGFQTFDPSILKDSPTDSGDGCIRTVNTLVVDVSKSLDAIADIICGYLPQITAIKHQMTKMIPLPRTNIPSLELDRFLDAPKQFAIYNTVPPGEFPEFEMPLPFQTGQGHGKTTTHLKDSTRRKHVQRVDALLDGIDLYSYTKRWKLDPGQRETISVQFFADTIGDFRGGLAFMIKDCRDDVFTLTLTGQCHYPDIDRSPEAIFPKVVSRLTSKTKNSFITSTNEFHFGPLVVGKERTNKNAPFLYRQAIKFTNNSLFQTDLSLSLSETGVRNPWGLDASSFSIQPGDTKVVNICFNPSSNATYTNTLTVLVKDNPDPLVFGCAGFGCSPMLELSTAQIDFEKMLLKQTRTMEIELRNPGRIPAFWRIKTPGQFQDYFRFSEQEGLVNPTMAAMLHITYLSGKPQIVKKQLTIEILDKAKAKIYSSHHVNLLAESFDVNIDFQYPKGMDSLLFGTAKVFQTKTIPCLLRNKGKYPSLCSFKHLS
jgi:hydrocephalus-inducing protein